MMEVEYEEEEQQQQQPAAAASAAGAPISLTLKAPPPVDPTMVLSDTERQWALELKRQVEANQELDDLCDMEYAHHALVAKGNVAEALYRMQSLQEFRRYHKIDNSIEQALYYIGELMKQQPGFVLNLNVDTRRQESIHAYDCAFFHPTKALECSPQSKAQTGIVDNWKICICGVYYMKWICQPTLATIRNGFLELIDFGDYEWENFSLEAQERLYGELLNFYPLIERHLLAYHTGHVANVGFSLAKAFMGPQVLSVVQLGCQIIENDESRTPTRRLRDFYLQPSRQVCEQNLLQRTQVLLSLRHKNEASFRL